MANTQAPAHPAPPAHPAQPATALPEATQPATEPDISQVPPDFKLAKVGSRDYVAGQPVDEAELQKTQDAAKARKAEGHAGEKQSNVSSAPPLPHASPAEAVKPGHK